jgi:putative transposase
MARKPRQLEVNKIYHVINRGVEKRTIFLKNQDYSRFILALEFFNNRVSSNLWQIIEKFNPTLFEKRLTAKREGPKKHLVELLAFTLMPNHYHLVLREIIPNGISLFMQKLGGYTSYFNKQYDRVGPLFQSRYKSVPIQDDIQLHTVFAYVHTNPIELVEPGWKKFKVKDREKAIEYLGNYKWSSYKDYIDIQNFPTVTKREFFLTFFGNTQKCKDVIKDWISWKANQASIDPKITE